MVHSNMFLSTKFVTNSSSLYNYDIHNQKSWILLLILMGSLSMEEHSLQEQYVAVSGVLYD